MGEKQTLRIFDCNNLIFQIEKVNYSLEIMMYSLLYLYVYMKIMNLLFIEIAKNNLREVFRNFKSNGIVFILPVVFIAIFGFIFNQNSSITFNIAVVSSEKQMLENTLTPLASVKNEDEENIFEIVEYDNADLAKDSVKTKDNDLLITLDENSKPKIIRDLTAPYSTAAEGIITSIIDNREPIISSEDIITQQDFNMFQRQVPGLLVYGILALIPQVAAALAVLKERNYIFRLFTSKVKSSDIILGFLLSQSVIAFIQTILLFCTAILFGFKPSGNILTAFLFIIPVNIFVVGVGLILGSLTSSSESAGNLGSMFSVILGFFSGSFFMGIENIKLFGSKVAIVDFIPSFYATEGMRNILLFSKNINDEFSNLLFISISGLLFLLLGVIIYQYKRMNRLN